MHNSQRTIRNTVCSLAVFLCVISLGCGKKPVPPAPPPFGGLTASLVFGNTPLPNFAQPPSRQQAIARWLRPVMGRSDGMAQVSAAALQVRPLVEAAAGMPEVQPYLVKLAVLLHMSVPALHHKWVALQTADLLLESGGDSNSLSSAGAAGVAQWLPETAQRAGLKVNVLRSNQLTAQIATLLKSAADAPPAGQKALQQKIAGLQTKRAQCDERYNAADAIAAQTRYLLRLAVRFPALDWLFQAYHGGEGGVLTLLRLYSGGRTSARSLILHGNHGMPLSFEYVYLHCTPHQHAAAFRYLYSRGDDDRHYWWKICAARQAVHLYLQNSTAFASAWQAMLPGQPLLAFWYGPLKHLEFGYEPAVKQALQQGVIQPASCPKAVCASPAGSVLPSGNVKALRSPALGMLSLLYQLYSRAGGKTPLVPGVMTLPAQPDPNAPGAHDNVYNTGLAFDIDWPENMQDRKIMASVLDRVTDLGVAGMIVLSRQGKPRWQIYPNPQYGSALQRQEQ